MARFQENLRTGSYAVQDVVNRGLDRVLDRLPAPVRRVAVMPSVQGLVMVVVALAILLITGPMSYPAYVVLLICVYLVSVYGVNVTIGFSGVLSLGQGAAFAVGAYVAGILAGTYMWPIWLTLPLALMSGVAVGALVGLPAGRLAALGLAMLSLGTVLVVSDMLVALDDLTQGHGGISGITPFLSFDPDSYVLWEWFVPLVIIGIAFLAFWFHARYRTSRIGRATAAVRDESIGASALGIGGYITKVAAFAVGSGMGGLAGALFAYLSVYISPDAFLPSLSILFLVMAVLGGLGSQLGPLVGVIILVIVPLMLAPYPHVNIIVYGVLLVLLMRLRPRGLFSRTAAAADPVKTSLRLDDASPAAPAGEAASVPGEAHVPGEAARAAAVTNEIVLKVDDVRRSFGGLKAVDGVTLELREGEILGLIGPNGSGKTTMLNIIGGYYRPSSGSVALGGVDISRSRPQESARRGIARTFQTPKTFAGMSIDEHIEIAVQRQLDASPERIAACRTAALALLEAGGLKPDDLKMGRRESRFLGHGQLRFLEAAMAVARCPKVLLLDEPAAGLSASEIDALETIVKEVARAGVAVIIVEHHLEMVSRLVDRIVVLDLGRVLWEGHPDELHDAEAVRAAYMGTV
ncbi:branched-chain amino acid transport system permease protein [Microbacterium trichothecenolyticum]|uniref:branched-chain amino acid ABC transporter ATP-binding protein/permease n=1 Tax=Microbacterium trichothecenolyticum TaxID=69370 RepID=UPI0028566CC3|nr:branched-chain amino acid ABC transporter ATP-binding protein/permease [Microbacterium trichothecenolyticum]MDR7112245.1 branched-chain amino acid transport system permease protein [Microbacterium trichothecenolyticum]